MIPKQQPYFISNQNKAMLRAMMARRAVHPVNLLITGKHGLGKSMLARQIAAIWKLDYVPVPICSLQEVGQLMGHPEFDQKSVFIPSEFVKAMRRPDTVIHLEELNRPESPKALGDLFPLLDDTRGIWHESLGEVNVAPGVVFIGTLNEGFEYSGIDPLDEALRDRFFMMRLDYLPNKIESTLVNMNTGLVGDAVDSLLDLVNRLRNNTKEPIHISTRRVLMMAELAKEGLPLREAFTTCIGSDPDKLESVLIELDTMGNRIKPYRDITPENNALPWAPGEPTIKHGYELLSI